MINLFKFRKIHKRKYVKIIVFLPVIYLFVRFLPILISSIDYVYQSSAIHFKIFFDKSKDFSIFSSELKNIKLENENLKNEIYHLKTKIKLIQNYETELNDLKNILNFSYTENNYKHIEKVVGFDANPYNSYLIISANNSETKPGKIIVSTDGLVGIVQECYNKFAKVKTICDLNMVVPVRLKSERLIISGTDRNQMISKEIQNISNLKELCEGDVFETSGDGGFFPSKIPVSIISKIDSEGGVVFSTPISDIANLSYVWVISSIKEETS